MLFGYRQHPRSRYFLLRFEGGKPREWLRRVLTSVTSGDDDPEESSCFNVAFSARGLSALGLDDEDLATFQREFVQGMSHPERARVLGDQGSDAPDHWRWGNAAAPVDAVAMLYARHEAELEERSQALAASLERFGITARVHDVSLPDDGREHFGFHTGSRQPFVKGSGRSRRRREPKLPTGELVLGYPNGYGEVSAVPTAKRRQGSREHPYFVSGSAERVTFGLNGTYLVLRQLQQDVAGFWDFCWGAAEAERAADVAEGAKLLAARLVGRWPNGVPLVDAPDSERPSDVGPSELRFREQDPDGLRCPFGAHVRRANPRDTFGPSGKEALREANLHRLVRRGRVYGPRLGGAMPRRDDGVERGLFFLALNADLRRQFEFVQQTWLNGAALPRERDPLVGSAPTDEGRRFTVPARPVRTRYEGLPKVVHVRGGEYFFLPGLRALNYLCDGGE
jgi:Dyp-type peroxidase family